MELKRVKIKHLKIDPIGKELSNSEGVRPYVDFFIAIEQKKDPMLALEKLQSLTLAERYTWRVLSALQWAFGDFDSASIQLDLDTMPDADKRRLLDNEHIHSRPVQMAFLLKKLYGTERMREMMSDAIRTADNNGPEHG